MRENDQIQLFENKRIRTAWDEEKEEWYFSAQSSCYPDNRRRGMFV